MPRLYEITTTLAARMFAMVGPFGVSIITARMLGPEDRGHYFLIFSYAQIAAQIANLGLHSSNTYLAANRTDLVGRLVVNSLYVAFFAAPLTALAIVLLADRPELLGFAPPAGGSAGPAAFAAILLAPLLVAFLYLTNIAIGIGRVQLFNGLSILGGGAAIVAAGIVAAYGGGTLDYLVAATAAIAVSCLVAASLVLTGNRTPVRFDLPLFREGVGFALRAYLATLFGFLMMRVGVLALQHRADFAEIGQFSIATQIAEALILLPSTVGLLLFPSLLRIAGGDRWQTAQRAFWRLGALMLVLLGIVAVVVPWATMLVFGPAYERAVPLTLAMLPFVLIISLITVLSQYLASEGYPWRQVWAWAVGFVVQAGLSYWLAGQYGGMGVAIALAISGSLVFTLMLAEAFAMRRRKRRFGQSTEIRRDGG